ncbi:MAG: hypothetical protein LKJ88_01180 [Bacilli bacterium]|jgi:flagellar biosynthesis/type III secretory pathway M-ring protein FliF/YscJ|nr:hypothetical protein [Bacilli bacterium]
MMTPEKRNRLKSIMYILITVICIAVIVFLLIRYIQVSNKLNSYKTSSTGLLPLVEAFLI